VIKTLRPIVDRKSYSQPIEAEMLQALWDAVFKPVFDILQVKTPGRVNSLQDLKNEFRSGRIFWQDGYVYGTFNSKIGLALRALGASFSSQKKAYKLAIGKIPMDLRADIVIGKGMNKTKTDRLLEHLNGATNIKLIIGSGERPIAMISSLNDQANQTFKVLPENLQLPMDLTERQKQDMMETYQQNLTGYLEDWKQEAIERLKEKTQKNAILGYRADRLEQIVKSEFGVTKKKAKFIARQETSMLVSKFREERYTAAGIGSYIWSTSHDRRVRDDHADLDHKVFSWDSPPIVDKSTGRRANPGEDFGCRCLALPVVRLGVS
jgi:SPP1 gp7 family putative phage head morphogenesis protein